jgi:hypothetical protein
MAVQIRYSLVLGLGDLLGKLNGLGDYASRRGQILILARIWSLAGVVDKMVLG